MTTGIGAQAIYEDGTCRGGQQDRGGGDGTWKARAVRSMLSRGELAASRTGMCRQVAYVIVGEVIRFGRASAAPGVKLRVGVARSVAGLRRAAARLTPRRCAG